MLQTIKAKAAQKRENGEGGFTLIELMVVVLIIAILLAIAIPTFLGAQNKAKDRAAQSGLRNTLTNAKTIYADTQDYTDVTIGASGTLTALETALTFSDATTVSTGPKFISIATPSTTTFVAASLSAAGDCFLIKDELINGGAGVTYLRIPAAGLAAAGGCDASATGTFGASW